MRARWPAAVGVVLVLAVTACAAPSAQQATDPAPKQTSAGQSSGQSSGQPSDRSGTQTAAAPAYRFTARTAEGAAFDGSRLAGRPALLWFWAPWCPTCRAQAPAVSDLARTHQESLQVVGVGGLDSAAAVEEYADELGGFPQLVDPDGAVWRHFGVTAQSTYVLLDAKGGVVVDGYLDDQDLAARIDQLVG